MVFFSAKVFDALYEYITYGVFFKIFRALKKNTILHLTQEDQIFFLELL